MSTLLIQEEQQGETIIQVLKPAMDGDEDKMAPNSDDAIFVPGGNSSFGGGLNSSGHSSGHIGAPRSPSKSLLDPNNNNLVSGPIGGGEGVINQLLGASGLAALDGGEDDGGSGARTGEEEEVIEVVPPGNSEAPPGTFSPLGGDMPLEGVRGAKSGRRNSDINSLSGSEANSLASTSSSWMPIPEAICVYHQRGSCLRLNCRFFHGTQEQLKKLQETGASHYRFDGENKVEVPKEGEDPLADSTSSGGGLSTKEPAVGVRYADANAAKGKKKPIVCLAYLSGTCRRADCRFTHLPPNVRPLPATSCAYFAVGTCKRNTCRYFHGTEDQLAKLKSQGATMYNPLTNEPYEKIPDFDEPPNKAAGARSDAAGSSGRGTPQVNSSNSTPFVASHQAPPPYQGGAPAAGGGAGGMLLVQTPPGPGGLVPPSPQQPGVQISGGPVSLVQPPSVPPTVVMNGQPVAMAAPLQQQQPPPQFQQQQQQQLYVQSSHGLIPLAPGQQAPPGAQVVSLPANPQQPAAVIPPQQVQSVMQQPAGIVGAPGQPILMPQQQQQPSLVQQQQQQLQFQQQQPALPMMVQTPQGPQLYQQPAGQILQGQAPGVAQQQQQQQQQAILSPQSAPKLVMMPDGTLRQA